MFRMLAEWLKKFRPESEKGATQGAAKETAADKSAPDDLQLLKTIEDSEAPSSNVFLQAFLRLRGTVWEQEALAHLASVTNRKTLSPELIEQAAKLHIERGEYEQALRLLAGAKWASGLMLLAEAQSLMGDLESACRSVEQAVQIDVTIVGALDRLRKWREQLGQNNLTKQPELQGATLLLPLPTHSTFKLLQEAGRGGSATVYEAIDETLGRKVALKVFHKTSLREQIENEAQALMVLAGAGVEAIFDAQLEESSSWIALEWADLGSIKSCIQRQDFKLVLPVNRWLLHVVQALARIHRAGWVHGDIKPANILFTSMGATLLSDFGLARKVKSSWEGGTLGYISPEREAGRVAEFDDDVYAVGALIKNVMQQMTLGEHEHNECARLVELCCKPSGQRPPNGDELLLALSQSSKQTSEAANGR